MADSPTPPADTPPLRTPGGSVRWEPPSPAELQALIPGYTIEKLLGKGGMGAVYKGVQISLDRPVAIKIISNDLDQADASFGERFKNEARAMAKLSHPGIVAVHDYGQTSNGILYIVMEYIEGTDVSRMIAQQKRLHSEHAMAITAHVCDALAYAHERGIIHRDIKPANIMVSHDGVVKVADFGLAKMMQSGESGLTQSGMAMGTLHYMAPEALMLGSAVDHRADIYAVGVMLYQMLTGKLPQGIFELPSLQVLGLDPRYDAIIAQAMREDRDIRYQTIRELRQRLDNILTQPVTQVDPQATLAPAAVPSDRPPQRPAGQPYRPPQSSSAVHQPPKKSSSLPWVAALVLAIAGGVGWLIFGAPKPAVTDQPLPPAVIPQKEDAITEKTVVVATPPATNMPVPVPVPAASAPMPSTSADEKPLPDKVPLTPTATPSSLTESFKGHRYQFVPGSFTWLDAKAKAESMGGHLATITTKEENEWLLQTYRKLLSKFNQNIWLGAIESAPGSGWKWVTGEPFLPLGWLPSEPNGVKGGGGSAGYPFMLNLYCFRDDIVGWNDSSTHESQVRASIGFIVEWESEPAKAPSAPVASATTWIDTKGRSLQAQFISLQGGSVILNIAGKTTPVQLSSLSAASQEIAQALHASRSASAKPATAQAPTTTLDLTKGYTNTLGMKFVPVPDTKVLFCIHEVRYKDYAAYAAENRGVNESWKDQTLDNYPITERPEDHPVIRVSWEDAQQFCAWLSRKEGRTYRLPTDEEWSIAVGSEKLPNRAVIGMLSGKEMSEYPWGGSYPPKTPDKAGNYSDESRKNLPSRAVKQYLEGYDDGFPTTSPVMSFKPNKFGLYDMGGNVWEWCEDYWFDNTQKYRVVRGGCYLSQTWGDLISSRCNYGTPSHRVYTYGFRVVLVVPGS